MYLNITYNVGYIEKNFPLPTVNCIPVIEKKKSSCRVKELGPGGPVEGKPAEIAVSNNINFGAMSPQNSDLAKLKTSNVRK